MIYETPEGKYFGILHIPRTGGRFLRINLMENGMKPIEWTPANNVLEYNYRSLCHLTKKELFEYLDRLGVGDEYRNIPFYSVCRSPADRFLSASNNIPPFLKEKMTDFKSFQSVMQDEEIITQKESCAVHTKGLIRTPDSFFRYQSDYIDEGVDFMRYEEGFEVILQWLSDELQINLKQVENQRVVDQSHIDSEKDVSDEILHMAKEYYIEDYYRFKYMRDEINHEQ
jgi:hypothetical protein